MYGLIDLHAHILYDIDDGPDTPYESMRLCEMAVENGIEQIVSTSHLLEPEDLPDFLPRRNDRILRLREQIEKAGLPLRIYPGAEVFVDEGIFSARHLDKLTINGSRYLLIEFEFHGLTPRRLTRYIDEIFRRDLVPIIAHPERYSFLQRDWGLVDYLAQRGALFQINADSLAGRTGREEFELAYRMARRGTASFIATDAHSTLGRPNDLLRMIRDFPPDLSRQNLDYMLYKAPSRVLANEEIPSVRRTEAHRRRYE